jgi:prephenate dehydratase
MDNLPKDFTDIHVAYQGAPGSYSYGCVLKNFPNAQPEGHSTFEGAIISVQEGTAEYALLPIENSIAGRVMDMHHLLAHSNLQIRAEYYHKIDHCFLAKRGADKEKIKSVYSHPMALAQCRDFIHDHHLETVPFTDTADAARYVSEQDSLTVAAVASEINADIYDGLEVLDRSIQDVKKNVTRFFLLSKKAPAVHKEDEEYVTAIFFTVKNIPAALFKSLSGFANNQVNVTKLESFMPLLGEGAARFYLEVAGAPHESAVAKSLELLAESALEIEILGSFACFSGDF